MKPQPAKAWPVVALNIPPWDEIKHDIWPVIEKTVKTFIIKFTYNDIIKWIAGEKSGKPAFISDFDDWLYRQADAAASQFLEETLGTLYKTLCTGININLALYWRPQFDVQYYIPQCTLSQIQRRFQNPGTEWVDFQLYLDDSNNDAGFLFQIYSKAQEKRNAIEYQHTITALSGQGYAKTTKDKDGKEIVETPGSAIAGLVGAAQKAPFDIITSSAGWDEIGSTLLSAIVIATLQRGVKTVRQKINK